MFPDSFVRLVGLLRKDLGVEVDLSLASGRRLNRFQDLSVFGTVFFREMFPVPVSASSLASASASAFPGPVRG